MIRPVLAARRTTGGVLAAGKGNDTVPVTSGLKFWFDGSDPASLFTNNPPTTTVAADGDAVAYGSDKSGTGNHVSQATANNRPLYKTNILNGRAVVRFDGSNDALETAAPVSTVTNNFCMIGVIKPGNTTSERVAFFNGKGDANGYGPAHSTNTSKKGLLRGGVAWDSSSENADTTANIYVFSRVSGSSKLYVAGTLLLTVATAPLTPTNLTRLGGHFSTRPANVDIGELLFYEAGLSNDDINLICNYLKNKWALTWNNI